MNELTYAIGDVHGCADLMRELVARIDADAAGRPYDLVFLGDYIDKGPATAATIERAMDLPRRLENGRVLFLKGNHEADLLASLGDERVLSKWLAMGGDRVLEEYGVAKPDALPRDVLAWLEDLIMFHEDERRYFVHAGLDPASPRDRQSDRARLTMRGDFLAKDHDFGRHVVHGHTPQASGAPEQRPFRTNIDTAAFMTGALTAAVFGRDADRPARFLQTDARALSR